MGNSLRAAVVVDTTAEPPSGVECKEILWPLEHVPTTGEVLIDLAQNLSIRQMEPVGRILSNILPQKLRVLPKHFLINSGSSPKIVTLKELKGISAYEQEKLARLWAQNAMLPASGPGKLRTMVSLAVDPPWQLRPNAKREIAVM
jgi:primosomal protein N' (replication factor Y)